MIVLGDLLAVQVVADVSQLMCPPAAEQAAGYTGGTAHPRPGG